MYLCFCCAGGGSLPVVVRWNACCDDGRVLRCASAVLCGPWCCCSSLLAVLMKLSGCCCDRSRAVLSRAATLLGLVLLCLVRRLAARDRSCSCMARIAAFTHPALLCCILTWPRGACAGAYCACRRVRGAHSGSHGVGSLAGLRAPMLVCYELPRLCPALLPTLGVAGYCSADCPSCCRRRARSSRSVRRCFLCSCTGCCCLCVGHELIACLAVFGRLSAMVLVAGHRRPPSLAVLGGLAWRGCRGGTCGRCRLDPQHSSRPKLPPPW